MPARLTRRRFVKTVAAGLAAAPAVCSRAAAPSRWRFLTESEAALVDAIAEQIIPGDQDPGAREAGVVNFIDKQLASRYRRHQQAYRDGLQAVDEASRKLFKGGFVGLTAAQQIAVLKKLEAAGHPFFRLIRDHTMQGFYGGPQHGGNRGYASYRMLGIDYPQIIGQNRYRRK